MAAINTTAANSNSSVTAAAIALMTTVKSPRHASEGVGSPQSRRVPTAAEGSAWNQIVRGESEPIATVPSSSSAVTEQVVTPMVAATLLVTLSQLGCPSLSVFLVFARLNGKIIPRELNGEYTCVWKQDGWVPAYYALAILTMLFVS
ncbi:hypothetical protein CsatB_019037 [Cannabis sativa]